MRHTCPTQMEAEPPRDPASRCLWLPEMPTTSMILPLCQATLKLALRGHVVLLSILLRRTRLDAPTRTWIRRTDKLTMVHVLVLPTQAALVRPCRTTTITTIIITLPTALTLPVSLATMVITTTITIPLL